MKSKLYLFVRSLITLACLSPVLFGEARQVLSDDWRFQFGGPAHPASMVAAARLPGTVDFADQGWVIATYDFRLSPELGHLPETWLALGRLEFPLEVRLNGVFLYRRGKLPPDAPFVQPLSPTVLLVPATVWNLQGPNHLELKIWKEGDRLVFPENLVVTGSQEAEFQLESAQFLNVTLFLVFFGINLLGGVYFLFLWVGRTQQMDRLYFALSTLLIGGYFLSLGSPVPLLPGFLHFSVLKACLGPSLGFLLLFIMAHFQVGLFRGDKVVIMAVLVGFSLFIMTSTSLRQTLDHFSTSLVSLELAMLFTIILMIKALWRRRPQAWVVAIGIAIGVVCGSHDVWFHLTGRMPVAWLQGIGFFAMEVSMFFSLAMQSSHTHRKLEESTQELVQQKETLEQKVIERTQSLIVALEEARAANQAKAKFLADISHEIRTPLNAVIDVCEITIEASQTGQEPETVKLILAEATRLLHMINQLLDSSKIDAHKLELENRPFDLRELFDTIETTMKLRMAAGTVHYAQNIAASVPRCVCGDPLRLRQILDNLLGNALKFTEAGSITLEVRALPQSGTHIELHCVVADTGIGIPVDRQATIFGHFQQAAASTARIYGGTGLGIGICRSLVELMRGSIQVASESGKGSRFSFMVLLETAVETTLPTGHLHDHQTEPFWQNAPRVLLAEDYLLNTEIIARHLSNAGWLVSSAANGQMAVDLFSREAFALVLMDINMPVLDGLEATRQIRLRNTWVPIIGLSASATPEDHERCKAAGMDELLAKPARRLPLLETIARLVPPSSYIENNASQLNRAATLVSPFHGHHLLKELDGDLAEFLRMVFGFIQESRQQLGQLRHALDSGDHLIVRRLAHTIRGGALNLGATPISEAARVLEQASEKTDVSGLEARLADLEVQFGSLEQVVSHHDLA